jgi:hypothetical protein
MALASRPSALRCRTPFPHLSLTGGRTTNPRLVSSGFPTRFPDVRLPGICHRPCSGILTLCACSAAIPRSEPRHPQKRISGHPNQVQRPICPSVWGVRPRWILVSSCLLCWSCSVQLTGSSSSDDVVDAAWEAGLGVHALIWVCFSLFPSAPLISCTCFINHLSYPVRVRW